MKVVRIDNFDRESDHYPDKLFSVGMSKEDAERWAATLNEAEPERSDHYYIVVEDDYVLRTYEP